MRIAPKIRVTEEEGEAKEPPAIQIGHAMRYHAIPLGTELEPFLKALSVLDKRFSRIPVSIRNHLEKIRLPASLRLYVSQQCHFCPATVEKWPVRLGAMVAMEEIAHRNPELASQVIDPLWESFHRVEDPVRGDIIYIFGESGNYEIAPRLEAVLGGIYDTEVKEAAKEALEKIGKKGNRP